MTLRNRVPGILLVTAAFGLSADLLVAATPDGSEADATAETIRALARFENLGDAEAKERLKRLEAVGEEIEAKWKSVSPDTYVRLLHQLAGELGTHDFRDSRQYYLSQLYALRALQFADALPLDTECELLGHATRDIGQDGRPLPPAAWATLRNTLAKAHLHAWQRVARVLNEKWDPSDTGFRSIEPPPETGLPAGVAPEAIKDARLRARYEADLAENRKKLRRAGEHAAALRLRDHWIPQAQKFLSWTYRQPPAAQGELEALLNEYIPDEAARRTVWEAVERQQMPASPPPPQTRPH